MYHPSIPEDQERSSFLIGKRIEHELLEKDEEDPDDEGVLKQYEATVISSVPGFPSWFNIKYDGDDAIYVERLHQELEKGNMKIKV